MSVVNLNWGAFPEGYEPTDPNDFVQQLAKIVTARLAGAFSTFNFGNTIPSADNQDKPWFRTGADGEFDRIYTYWNGRWVSPHLTPANGQERRLWVGTKADLRSYDGGDGTTDVPTATAGAMWEVDGNFAARFILAPGELPSGTVVAVGNEGGAEQHTLTADEGAAGDHRHVLGRFGSNSGAANDDPYMLTGSLTTTGLGRRVSGQGELDEKDVTHESITGDWLNSSLAGAQEDIDPHNNMPPWRAAYVIQRTGRIYHTVP
jgi:hypothetical protein